VSESFLNRAVGRAFRNLGGGSPASSRKLRRILASDAVYALVPGLREIGTPEELSFALTFHSVPEIKLGSFGPRRGGPGIRDRAMIRARLVDVELALLKGEGPQALRLGTVEIESGRVGVVPYPNVLGGISFETVENQWSLSSSGIEFDEEVLTAAVQEIVFGEIFETAYEPVGRGALGVGEARLEPRAVELVEDYLVIGLTGSAGPPRRGGSPRASR
jgi:hypothetical protein